MPLQPLPGDHAPGSANRLVLPVGTLLWRLHRRTRRASAFVPPRADPIFTGTRFNGTNLYRYQCYYTAEDPTTALAEVLLRRRMFDDGKDARLIAHAEVAGRLLSAVRTKVELSLISLVRTRDLAAVSQDDWLLNVNEDGWAYTRAWAGQLWTAESGAQGLVWPSRRNSPERAIMLFGGRCGRAPFEARPHRTVDLDRPEGIEQVNSWLRPLRAAVDAPPPPA